MHLEGNCSIELPSGSEGKLHAGYTFAECHREAEENDNAKRAKEVRGWCSQWFSGDQHFSMAQGFVLFLRIPPETKDKQDNNDDEDDGKKIGSEKPKKILPRRRRPRRRWRR